MTHHMVDHIARATALQISVVGIILRVRAMVGKRTVLFHPSSPLRCAPILAKPTSAEPVELLSELQALLSLLLLLDNVLNLLLLESRLSSCIHNKAIVVYINVLYGLYVQNCPILTPLYRQIFMRVLRIISRIIGDEDFFALSVMIVSLWRATQIP